MRKHTPQLIPAYFQSLSIGVFLLFLFSASSSAQVELSATFNGENADSNALFVHPINEPIELKALLDMGTMPVLKFRIDRGETLPNGTFAINSSFTVPGCEILCPTCPTSCQNPPPLGEFLLESFPSVDTDGDTVDELDSARVNWIPNIPGTYRIIFFDTDEVLGTNLTFTIEVLAPDAIPTMSEWGIFLFALMMLTLGVVTLFNMQFSVAGNGAASSNFRLPFDRAAYLEAMKHACGLGLVGFVVIYIGWGEITGLDVFGMGLSVPLLAYLIQVMGMFPKK